jgi:RNA polymerase sigma-70 factor (ECF subfamily)
VCHQGKKEFFVALSLNSLERVPARAQEFVTTHWSVVLAAAENDSRQSATALETLCRAYWHPLYFYIRRQGHPPHTAQDLTQEFFLRLLQRNQLAAADPNRGRFRSFLLTALKNFLTNEWEKTQTIKRGGGQAGFSLDAQDAEGRYLAEGVDHLTPDRVYEKEWGVTLVENVLSQLRAEYVLAGKSTLFEALKEHVWGGAAEGYAQVAARLNTTEGATRVAAHRMRDQFRRLLRREVAHTVACAEEIDAELRHLIQVLRSP